MKQQHNTRRTFCQIPSRRFGRRHRGDATAPLSQTAALNAKARPARQYALRAVLSLYAYCARYLLYLDRKDSTSLESTR